MPNRYIDLQGTRLFYDVVHDTIRLSCTDPRLGGESFVMQLTPGTRAEELARAALKEEGIAVRPKMEVANSDNPRPISKHYLQIPIGSQPRNCPTTDSNNTVYWDMRYYNRYDNFPSTLAVFGKSGSGKSAVLGIILEHALNFLDDFDIYVYQSGESDIVLEKGHQILVDELTSLPVPIPGKRRLIILDSIDERTGHNPEERLRYRKEYDGFLKILRDAHANHDIVVFSAQEANGWLQYASHFIALGGLDLRSRISLGIDQFGRLAPRQGVLVNFFESKDSPEERSMQTFNVFAQEMLTATQFKVAVMQ